ncbi:hypothetical protein J6590_066865 [Homalodisca vitripennis]|nr:hypothetical protein J6590_066865 [Homalodisca vitripennis]
MEWGVDRVDSGQQTETDRERRRDETEVTTTTPRRRCGGTPTALVWIAMPVEVVVQPHSSLNTSKGIVFCRDLMECSEEEIKDELQCEMVTDVVRMLRKENGRKVPTPLILTFALPQTCLPELSRKNTVSVAQGQRQPENRIRPSSGFAQLEGCLPLQLTHCCSPPAQSSHCDHFCHKDYKFQGYGKFCLNFQNGKISLLGTGIPSGTCQPKLGRAPYLSSPGPDVISFNRVRDSRTTRARTWQQKSPTFLSNNHFLTRDRSGWHQDSYYRLLRQSKLTSALFCYTFSECSSSSTPHKQ